MLPAAVFARGSEWLDYREGLVQSLLAEGKTVLLDYFAPWCSTCRAQERVMLDLIEENSDYARKITFVVIDWDTYKRHSVTTSRGIPRRSTLVLQRGNQELGRVVAQTKRRTIKALLDKGLS